MGVFEMSKFETGTSPAERFAHWFVGLSRGWLGLPGPSMDLPWTFRPLPRKKLMDAVVEATGAGTVTVIGGTRHLETLQLDQLERHWEYLGIYNQLSNNQ